jgi:hypothetical protein
MVEAPGVEGRGMTCDFVMSHEASCEKAADSPEKPEGGSAVSAVSCGLAEAGCSTEVSGPSEGLETTLNSTRERAAASSMGSESAAARLAALEHLLDAVTTLLDAGESGPAMALARAWRDSRR